MFYNEGQEDAEWHDLDDFYLDGLENRSQNDTENEIIYFSNFGLRSSKTTTENSIYGKENMDKGPHHLPSRPKFWRSCYLCSFELYAVHWCLHLSYIPFWYDAPSGSQSSK